MFERKKRVRKSALSNMSHFQRRSLPRARSLRNGKGDADRYRQIRRETLDFLYAASSCIARLHSAALTLPELFEILAPAVSIQAAVLFERRPEGVKFFAWEIEPGHLLEHDEAKVRTARTYTYLSGYPTPVSPDGNVRTVGSPFRPASTHSTITLPLVVDREPMFGVLQLSCCQMDESKLSILNGIGNQLAMALDRRYQLKQQKEHFLREQDAIAAVKEAEARRISEARFRVLAESAPMLVWIAGSDGAVEYVNRRWIECTGLTQEQTLGEGWLDAIHPDDRARVWEAWRTAVTERSPYESETRIRTADGSFRWHLTRAVLDHADAKGIIRWTGTCTDIDGHKRWEEELVAARQKAESANLAKSAFLANMSHEIRTPVGIIMGYTGLLLDQANEEEEQSVWLKAMKRNSEVLLDLINELLDLSKVESGRLVIEPVEMNLMDFVKDASNLMAFKAKEKGIEFRVSCENALPETIHSDPTRLRQIFLNIVGNAIKFTERGEVNLTVRIARGTPPDQSMQIEFEVQDTGIGVSAEQQDRIWEPFMQADISTTRKYGGTGLGLSLSLRLAHALGGDLRLVQSTPGKGSTFAFRIDSGVAWEGLRDVVPGKSAVVLNGRSDVIIGVKQQPLGFERGSLRGSRVLVVEDAPDNQALIRRYLEVEGARVDLASDGSEGILSAETGAYDVVLMDIQMPGGVDGYAATEKLRRSNFKKPIIALTAHGMKSEMEKAKESGFDEYLVKPIDRDLLIKTVCKHIRGENLRWFPSKH
ncbi:MAG TPA: response regulator [Oligoflexus sp.]|uniref:PAS domain-containing hybrid sensor histidine kinase/response regulator n=1 Tax=Oligoflexus sp. TaxID=1971216 RepID=UPI002D267DC9|nr:response regulator [Oligoflexus sp.]HYX35639.1 response regulator [Oligoflexus sp.]